MIIIVLLFGVAIGTVIHFVSLWHAQCSDKSQSKPREARPLPLYRQKQVIDLKRDALYREADRLGVAPARVMTPAQCRQAADLARQAEDLDDRIARRDASAAQTWRWLRWIVVPIVVVLAVLWLNGFALQLGQDIVYSFGRH